MGLEIGVHFSNIARTFAGAFPHLLDDWILVIKFPAGYAKGESLFAFHTSIITK